MSMESMTPADYAAVSRNDNAFGDGGWFMWIFALLLLPGLFGGGGFGNRGGNPVTEADLCQSNNFVQLQNSIGRLGDQANQNNIAAMQGFTQLGYQNLEQSYQIARDQCTGFANAVAATNAVGAQMQQCCCETQRAIDGVNYNNAINTAAINANTTEQTQKILDAINGNRMADMQAKIQALELSQAVAGVVRYPTTFAYNAGQSPFCGGTCGCGC